MSYVDVYGVRREAEVMQDTWGHLAPKVGREYAGTVVYVLGCFGDLAVMTAEFDGLDDSPWFWEDLHNWIWDQKPEEGRIYRFVGTYNCGRDDRFAGEVRPIEIPEKTP